MAKVVPQAAKDDGAEVGSDRETDEDSSSSASSRKGTASATEKAGGRRRKVPVKRR